MLSHGQEIALKYYMISYSNDQTFENIIDDLHYKIPKFEILKLIKLSKMIDKEIIEVADKERSK